jgi:hypothetical protein
MRVGDVSHPALFQRIAAVVHHGGTGADPNAAFLANGSASGGSDHTRPSA